jgi:hypothetical protein
VKKVFVCELTPKENSRPGLNMITGISVTVNVDPTKIYDTAKKLLQDINALRLARAKKKDQKNSRALKMG